MKIKKELSPRHARRRIIKNILLLGWLALLFVSPTITNDIDYITFQQLEFSYVLLLVLFAKDARLNAVFAFCYTWFAFTDFFIKAIPLWLINIESILFFTIAMVLSNRLTR